MFRFIQFPIKIALERSVGSGDCDDSEGRIDISRSEENWRFRIFQEPRIYSISDTRLVTVNRNNTENIKQYFLSHVINNNMIY